ncbi:inosine-uridine nucleoside N-ribohydrolase [Catalinimonas alkaloidigena]|uniref:hypothetical protein n=1 Tax=Catalinimonas alkaloidigena TaxID=1075417 RepID=UPI0024067ED1|nr:hypothetical protein [Catalinimonas alkaloidigena]MDF9795730.1 inosine-uridine nucleoside N-ribohydrolase [Catalinimonas alkaloidigena]
MLLGGIIISSVAGGINYMINIIFKQKKAYTYCIAGALLNIAMLPPLIPEMRQSIKKLWGR